MRALSKRDGALALAVLVSLSGVTLTAGCAPHQSEPTTQSVDLPAPIESEHPTLTLPPCPVEDAENCYWDAARMGNGLGRSFVNIDGTYYYPEAE